MLVLKSIKNSLCKRAILELLNKPKNITENYMNNKRFKWMLTGVCMSFRKPIYVTVSCRRKHCCTLPWMAYCQKLLHHWWTLCHYIQGFFL